MEVVFDPSTKLLAIEIRCTVGEWGLAKHAVDSLILEARSTTNATSEHTPTGDNENHWKRYDI